MAIPNCKGICHTCGYLGLRERPAAIGFEVGRPVIAVSPVWEVPPESRASGNLFGVPSTQDGSPEVGVAICVRGIPIAEDAEGGADAEAGRKILDKPRNCDLWTEYRCGLSPREHIAFMFLERLEQDRRDWNAKFAERNRELDSQQAERDKAERKRHHGTMVGIAVATAILAFASLNADSLVWQFLLGLTELLSQCIGLRPF